MESGPRSFGTTVPELAGSNSSDRYARVTAFPTAPPSSRPPQTGLQPFFEVRPAQPLEPAGIGAFAGRATKMSLSCVLGRPTSHENLARRSSSRSKWTGWLWLRLRRPVVFLFCVDLWGRAPAELRRVGVLRERRLPVLSDRPARHHTQRVRLLLEHHVARDDLRAEDLHGGLRSDARWLRRNPVLRRLWRDRALLGHQSL